MKRTLSHVFLLSGIVFILFAGFLYTQRFNPNRVAFAIESPPAQLAHDEDAMPAYLRIPSLDVELPIFPAQIIDNKWDATTEGVSYLSSSPLPGSIGNSIMYGHNFPNLLGKLPKIEPGDEIQVGFHNYTQKEFVVESVAVVTPEDTGILLPSKDKRLTIYTCTGFLDTKRFVVIAKVK